MHLDKFIASLVLGASLLTSPLQIKSEEKKYFFEAGFGTKINEDITGKFNVKYIFDEETFSIEGGISETCDVKALYFEAMLDYLFPFKEGGGVYCGAGISAMSFTNNITTSDGQSAIESDSAFGVPINIGIKAPFPKNDNIESKLNLGMNLTPFEGPIFSGTFFTTGIRFRF